MNEQEFNDRRQKLLRRIDNHVPSAHAPISPRIFGWANRMMAGALMSPAFVAWFLFKPGQIYFGQAVLWVMVLVMMLAAFGAFLIVTLPLVGLSKKRANDSHFNPLKYLLAATYDMTCALFALFRRGALITPTNATAIAEFVKKHPCKRDVISSWAAQNKALEFTTREVDCIERVRRDLRKLDVQWERIQRAAANRREVNQVLDQAGISGRVSSMVQSSVLSAATEPASATAAQAPKRL